MSAESKKTYKARKTKPKSKGKGNGKGKEKKERSFEVNELRACRVLASGQKAYLVHWKYYDDRESTWEPASHIDSPGLIDAYEQTVSWTWQYHIPVAMDGYSVGWHEINEAKQLEEAFAAWSVDWTKPSEIELRMGTHGRIYTVSFLAMSQTSKKSMTTRAIRRVPLPALPKP